MKKLLFVLAFINAQVLIAQSEGITPEDVAKIEYVLSAEINNDGSKIIYSVVKPADPTKENVSASLKLWIYDVSSSTSIPFVTNGSVRSATFRPGHQTITFLSRRQDDNSTSLYEIPLSGGEARKLVAHSSSISSYEWSPDGKKLMFLAKEPGKEKSSLPYEPIIYEENLQLTRTFIHDSESGSVTEVPIEGNCYDAHWSPDGSKLCIAAAPTALVDDSYMRQVISIVDANSFNKTGSIAHAGKLGQISWSPDGSSLALIAGADIHDPIAGRLFIVPSNGGTPKSVIPDFKGKFETISWADNNSIRFIASEGVLTSIGTISKNGKKMDKLIDKGNEHFTALSASANNKLVMVGSAPQHPGELFMLEGKTAKRLTNSNPWLSERKMGKQEVITYKAKDGLELEGIVILPVDYSKGTRYPLITVVHGGPEAHFDNGWLTAYSRPGQVAAASDYIVFYPNYRGSTGRGEEFAKSSQADPGGLEFDDIIDGVDYLIDAGMVDKSKVGVTGGSYGGYATAWMSTRHTERFAAGVMMVGISNNLSKWGTSDIPEEMFLVHSRKRIWDDYEFFLKRSPIYYAGDAKTPLLILHGAGDTRVDPGQSKELYRHIKTRTDTPVRLVLYPGEGHGNRNATARFDYNMRMMRWFNLYLKQGGGDIPETELEME